MKTDPHNNLNYEPKLKKYYFLLLLLLPAITLFSMEAIHRGSITAAFSWAFFGTTSFIGTYLLIVSVIGVLFLLPRRLFIPALFLQSIFWIVVAFGSYKKYQLRGDYFSPYDFYLLKEATAITENMSGIFSPKLIVAALILLGLLIVASFYTKKISFHIGFRKRLIVSIIAMVGLTLLVKYPIAFSSSNSPNLTTNYKNNGLVGGFINTWKSKVDFENGYDQEHVKKILASKQLDKQKSSVDPLFQPNVIVILGEAVWDPLLLENVTFKEDPIPFIRKMMDTENSGTLLTHIFGGGTINTEMEILTGLTTRFLPEGSETYNHNLTRPIDSLAHNFRNQGYNTAAIHTFKNWFYDRNLTYKNLGFEKFMSMEFFSNPEMIGPYIDDRELMKQTLLEMNKTEGPDFLNVVTVSSHGPYDDIRYQDLPITTEGPLTDIPEYILNLYLKVLNEFDQSMQLLIEGIEESNEPTMVVLYGDHLPMLGYDYAVYREANYFQDLNNYEDHKKMHDTPLIVWDNFSKNKKPHSLNMTPNFLGSYILDQAKKEKSPIFQLSGELLTKGTTIIPPREYWEEEQIDEKSLEDYKLVQFDTLFGQQLTYEYYPVKTVKDYFLGSERMEISEVILDNKKSKNAIRVKGSGFVSNANVYIDGVKQKTTFINSNELISKVPSKLINNSDDVKIRVELLDDQDNTISESNTISLDLSKL